MQFNNEIRNDQENTEGYNFSILGQSKLPMPWAVIKVPDHAIIKLGDGHGSFLALLHRFYVHGFFQKITEKSYKAIYDLYHLQPEKITKQSIKDFIDTLNLAWDDQSSPKNVVIKYLGDIIGDRGENDLWVHLFNAFLHKKKTEKKLGDLIFIIGNHDVEALFTRYEQGTDDGFLFKKDQQKKTKEKINSLLNYYTFINNPSLSETSNEISGSEKAIDSEKFFNKISQETINIQELDEYFWKIYVDHAKIVSVEHVNNQLWINTHAPIDWKVLFGLASLLGVEDTEPLHQALQLMDKLTHLTTKLDLWFAEKFDAEKFTNIDDNAIILTAENEVYFRIDREILKEKKEKEEKEGEKYIKQKIDFDVKEIQGQKNDNPTKLTLDNETIKKIVTEVLSKIYPEEIKTSLRDQLVELEKKINNKFSNALKNKEIHKHFDGIEKIDSTIQDLENNNEESNKTINYNALVAYFLLHFGTIYIHSKPNLSVEIKQALSNKKISQAAELIENLVTENFAKASLALCLFNRDVEQGNYSEQEKTTPLNRNSMLHEFLNIYYAHGHDPMAPKPKNTVNTDSLHGKIDRNGAENYNVDLPVTVICEKSDVFKNYQRAFTSLKTHPVDLLHFYLCKTFASQNDNKNETQLLQIILDSYPQEQHNSNSLGQEETALNRIYSRFFNFSRLITLTEPENQEYCISSINGTIDLINQNIVEVVNRNQPKITVEKFQSYSLYKLKKLTTLSEGALTKDIEEAKKNINEYVSIVTYFIKQNKTNEKTSKHEKPKNPILNSAALDYADINSNSFFGAGQKKDFFAPKLLGSIEIKAAWKKLNSGCAQSLWDHIGEKKLDLTDKNCAHMKNIILSSKNCSQLFNAITNSGLSAKRGDNLFEEKSSIEFLSDKFFGTLNATDKDKNIIQPKDQISFNTNLEKKPQEIVELTKQIFCNIMDCASGYLKLTLLKVLHYAFSDNLKNMMDVKAKNVLTQFLEETVSIEINDLKVKLNLAKNDSPSNSNCVIF